MTNGAPNMNHNHHHNNNNNQPQLNQKHSTAKKDLFTSRGWGAAGMPFSVFYLNSYARLQQQEAIARQQQQLQKQRQTTARFGGDGYNVKAMERIMDTDGDETILDDSEESDDEAGTKTNSLRRNYTAPQLFVSYGWGPMGK